MATGSQNPVCFISCFSILFIIPTFISAQVLTPPYFNLAKGRNITATSTCGVGVPNPELYCRLTGSTGVSRGSDLESLELIQGQLCDYCSPERPERDHRPEFAIDGTERWWQSPPLSRVGLELNRVNLTVNLGQEFHVAYVFIKMANSPRPGVWVLERSLDFGKNYQPWQYFADTPSDCFNFFNVSADQKLTSDDQILCSTEFSKVVPLSNGEIVISLVNDRPSAHNFSYATGLQEWTKATDVRLRLLRTKNLLGHLMAIARQDPTVTRRYYYSIKDISIGGRCVCNGHAGTCDSTEVNGNKLLCDCQHNTCGAQCDECCPGFTQKRWRRALIDQPFECEPCECYGHSDVCIFDEEVEANRLSIDIHGTYEGGGVCQNCSHNTMGINCEQCIPSYYRPYDVPKNSIDACRPCQCDLRVSTGECEEGSGRCLCRQEYAGVNCDRCNFGYHGYPDCVPCDCDVSGTEGNTCTVASGTCPCKYNYAGPKCDQCAPGYYNFSECQPCECNPVGSPNTVCDQDSGQCDCLMNFGGRDCGECANGYYNFPVCEYCNCDESGSEEEICDKDLGICMCKPNYDGRFCERCQRGYYNFPNCTECQCDKEGSLSSVCASNGQCRCKPNYGGMNCDRCAAGFYRYPDCTPCNCDMYGSLSRSCDQTTGSCECRSNFVGLMCDKCGENFYNYPMCEVCDCNPNGAKEIPGYPLGGCGIITSGLLCECKDKVQGRICDQCKEGYWNLNRNNPDGCEECGCHKPGTLLGLNQCDMTTGQCMCKPNVGGQDCNRCLDGFFDLSEDNPFGCQDCNCDLGGSQHLTCNKMTGQCICKPRVSGKRCDQPISGHFFPSLHQYKYEIEDGKTPEGARIRYGYDERIFPEFSWRGYAILTAIQPEVLLDIDIRIPSLYQVIFSYVNRENNAVKGKIVLTPESPTEPTQTGEIVFVPSQDPKYSSVSNAGLVQSFVLDPGRWTVSTNVPDNIFLDYFVLIPQAYYEASNIQQRVTDSCSVPNDPGPCVHFGYPNLTQYPSSNGSDGYVIGDTGDKVPVALLPDSDIVGELGSSGVAHINNTKDTLIIELQVPDPDDYLIVFTFYNPKKTSHELDVEVATPAGRDRAIAMLSSCGFSSFCRQVLKNMEGTEAVFNISSGFATLYITAKEEGVDIGLESVYVIPASLWNPNYILPRIICIKVNGICVPSTYGRPVGGIRIDFEQPPNENLISERRPPNILDPTVGLVYFNDTVKTGQPLELFGSVREIGQHVFMVHYYMPNVVGMNIPVTVYVDGKISTGTFKPHFCPNVVGCRSTIVFDQSGDKTIKLPETDVRVVFNNTQGGQIWLDYLSIIPANNYRPGYFEHEPVDKSGDFLANCVDDGFQLKADNEFCRDGAFTLTTNFNNGALDCRCNADGSESFTCESYAGQCPCKENIIGRTCSACRPDYYGFPNCRPCNCPYGLCEEDTGVCICPPLVTGDRCDICEPEAYGYDALIGCQQCNCDYNGVADRDLTCDQLTGQCRCKDNVGGRRCDTCLPGHHSFPWCQDCGCDRNGTVEDICDQQNAQCLCKNNVEGQYCRRCSEGMFSLSGSNPNGCTKCFCFGHTTRCSSADYKWDEGSDMSGWLATNSGDQQVQESGSTIRVSSLEDEQSLEAFYWIAPYSYLGRKIFSYGGSLKFTVFFTLPREKDWEGLVKPDVVLTGSNMTIIHFHDSQPAPNTPHRMDVPLFEYNFVHERSNAPVSREQFMMLLSDLNALAIRGSYVSVVGEMRLSDVVMQMASDSGIGEVAENVEMCQCPLNYQGLSCEECSPGYYRSRTSPYLGICSKCNCNGHSEECDVMTGECYNCGDNTTGPHCEQCIAGYHGDPLTGGCQICACPLPLASNNFATSCNVDAYGYTSCACIPGYTGQDCSMCDSGYYGNPVVEGEFCQPCDCSGNIDMSDPRSCNSSTGACVLCSNDTAGANCEMCQDWFWGDAISRKDCQECSCDQCGSELCDKDFGVCQCKLNVEGIDCDQCRPNTWGFEECNGCRECECGIGSESAQCNLLTGICSCQPGVEGEKCDHCKPGHWNYGPSGCQECNCLTDGAVGCDAETGRCMCLPGVTGEKCDRCLPRWVLVPTQGCQECDYCIHLLIDDLDILTQNVSVISRQLGEVSVGIGAFNKLAYYNDTVQELRPEVDALGQIDNETFVNMLKPLEIDVEALKQDCKANHSKSEAIHSESTQLPDNVQDFVVEAMETEKMVQDLHTIANDTLKHIDDVRVQILSTSSTHNLDYLISEGERITEEISARNFSRQNDSSTEEKNAADMAMEDAKQMKMDGSLNLNKTVELKHDVEDLNSRLYDLQNSSRYASADSDRSLSGRRRLTAVQMESLSRSLKELMEHEKETKQMVEEGNKLNNESESLLAAANKSVQDVETESSRMETAIPKLELHVVEIAMSIEDLISKTNYSMIYAQNLVGLAEDMNMMYESTRNISESAVMAGQAYYNILDAVSEASNSSLQALIDNEATLEESLGIGSNVSESIQVSEDILATIDDMLTMDMTEEKKKLTEVEDQLVTSQESHMEVRKELEAVRNKMDQLDGASTAEQAENVIKRADEASAEVDNVMNISQPILDKVPEDKEKMNFIVQNVPKAEDHLRSTQDNVDSIETSQPEMNDLLDKLSVSAETLSDTGRRLELNVEALKEKIAQARHEANRIRVGLKYLGNTTVTLRNPDKLDDTGSFTTLSLFFKTVQSDAFMMYVGNNVNSANPDENRSKRSADVPLTRVVRQAVEYHSDYLALEMKGGRVAFTYNLGSGPGVLISDRLVNDGNWHQVVCSRIGKSGTLTVKSDKMDDEVKEGTSAGTFTVLELNPVSTKFIFGGVPSDVMVPSDLSSSSFEGSMEEIKFDGEPMGLWNFVEAQNNVEGEKEGDLLQEVFVEGTRFSGTGYVVLGKKDLSLNPARTKVSLFFKTYAKNGLLFYMGNKDYFAIDMRDGHVIFQYDLGGGAAVMETRDTYNDGEWHKVTIDRIRRKAVLIIDDNTEKIEAESKGKLNNLETTNFVYLGGVDNVIIPSSNVVSMSFNGCMKDITIGSLPVDLSDNKRAKGIINGCVPKVTRVVTFPTSKGAYVALDPVNVGSMFDVTFKFKTVNSDGLLVYTSDEPQANTFAVSLRKGHIVVTEELGSQSSELKSKINTYGDGDWHYVSIMMMKQELTMSIDDFEMVSTKQVQAELFTTSQLYFGGLPYDYKVTSNAFTFSGGVKGCMGDITVNKKFQNLAHAPNEGVSFAECSVEKALKTTVPPSLNPDQCALPQVSSDFEFDQSTVDGIRFDADIYSRQEFKKLPVRILIKPIVLAITFKTTGVRGVLFYTADKRHRDFLSVYMRNGQVHYGFNCGSGSAVITSPDTYNDGEWHTVKVSRRHQQGTLEIDGIRVGTGKSRGPTRSLNTKAPYYLGGLREEIRKVAAKNLGEANVAFMGCVKDVSMNMMPMLPPSAEHKVQPCSDSVESGTFIGLDGGSVKLYDKFKVGRTLDIVMDVKPRSKEGVLLAVHKDSKKGDFVLLQISGGQLILSTDNGAGVISTTFPSATENALCDGQWHTIRAVKDKNKVTLSVDDQPAQSVEGSTVGLSADTMDPLYIGGFDDKSARGLISNGSYVGCIRNLFLNGKLEYITRGMASGDVKLDSCPQA